MYCGVNPADYIADELLGQICMHAPSDDSDAELGEGNSCYDHMVNYGEKVVNDRRLQKLMRLIKLRPSIFPEIELRIARFIFNHDGDDRKAQWLAANPDWQERAAAADTNLTVPTAADNMVAADDRSAWRQWLAAIDRQERTAAGPMPAAADNMVYVRRLPTNPGRRGRPAAPMPAAADNMVYDRRLAAGGPLPAAREADERRWVIQWLAGCSGRREWIAQWLATNHDAAAADTSLTMPRAADNMAPAADDVSLVSLISVGGGPLRPRTAADDFALNMPSRDIRLNQQNPMPMPVEPTAQPRTSSSGRTGGAVRGFDHHRRHTTETEAEIQ